MKSCARLSIAADRIERLKYATPPIASVSTGRIIAFGSVIAPPTVAVCGAAGGSHFKYTEKNAISRRKIHPQQ
jgi:hypothetical protein